MLFSNKTVAAYINQNFEPAWESVRAVPRVTIDFGNGIVLNRTLHGNVATYVCTSEGKVLDVLPGVYDPRTYGQRLSELKDLFAYAVQEQGYGVANQPLGSIQEYHDRQAQRLENKEQPERLINEVQRSITGAERGTKIMLRPVQRMRARAMRTKMRGGTGSARGNGRSQAGKSAATKPLATTESLAADTLLNETQRRLQIHRHLARSKFVTPNELKGWLYREVLHADLADPYLGLGKLLFSRGSSNSRSAEQNSSARSVR